MQPADSGVNSDRKIMAPFNPTIAQKAAIFGHAPQVDGNINDSDFDFCDAPELGGVFGLWAGIGEADLLLCRALLAVYHGLSPVAPYFSSSSSLLAFSFSVLT
eukprot:SAG31_NODE_7132_length_1780_cov_2.946460_3_plen_102_part_01